MFELISIAREVCGIAWLSIAGLIALLNLLIALKMTFSSRSVIALIAFMPVTLLPLAIGVVGAAIGLLQAVEVSIGEQRSNDSNATLLLAWALVPLALGGAFSIPAYATAAIGRLWLATRSVQPKAPSLGGPVESSFRKNDLDDKSAYQAYADLVTTKGHRKS